MPQSDRSRPGWYQCRADSAGVLVRRVMIAGIGYLVPGMRILGTLYAPKCTPKMYRNKHRFVRVLQLIACDLLQILGTAHPQHVCRKKKSRWNPKNGKWLHILKQVPCVTSGFSIWWNNAYVLFPNVTYKTLYRTKIGHPLRLSLYSILNHCIGPMKIRFCSTTFDI